MIFLRILRTIEIIAANSEWEEERRQEWLIKELTSKRPLMPPSLEFTPEVADVINTFRTISNLPPDSLAAYVISMAHTASDVLAVVLLQARPVTQMYDMHAMPILCADVLSLLERSRSSQLWQ